MTCAVRSYTHWCKTLTRDTDRVEVGQKFIPMKVKSCEGMRSDLSALRRSPKKRSSFQGNSRFRRSS